MSGEVRAQGSSVYAPSPTPPLLAVTAPASGATLHVGSAATITWVVAGSASDVMRIDWSTDGSTWTTIVNTLNTGSYAWTVDAPESSTLYIRVTGPTASATSGAVSVVESALLRLIRKVRMRMGDFPQAMRDTDNVGDGVTTQYRLYDYVYEGDGVEVSIAGEDNTDFTVDYDSGWLTLDSAPDADAELVFSYSCVLHTDEQITDAINAAIDDCFGALVVQGENATLVTDGTPELLCTKTDGTALDTDDIIERVEYWNDPYWVTIHDWSVRNFSGSKYLHFRRLPVSGVTIRISYITRPGTLSVGGEELDGIAGLPERAQEPVVLFACAKLFSQQLNTRAHSNLFHNVEGYSAPKVFDLRMRIQDLQAEGELALRRVRPRRVAGSF